MEWAANCAWLNPNTENNKRMHGLVTSDYLPVLYWYKYCLTVIDFLPSDAFMQVGYYKFYIWTYKALTVPTSSFLQRNSFLIPVMCFTNSTNNQSCHTSRSYQGATCNRPFAQQRKVSDGWIDLSSYSINYFEERWNKIEASRTWRDC